MSDLFAKIYHTDVIDRIPEIGHMATIVYLVLARHADKDGVCWPSLNTIGTEGKMSQRSVSNGIRALELAGLIAKENRTAKTGGDQSNRYTLSPHEPVEPDTHPGSTRYPRGLHQIPTPIAPDTHGGSTRYPLRRTNEEEPIEEEPLKQKSRALRFDVTDLQTAEWMFSLIQQLNPGHRKPNLEKWASDIRLIRERDDRTDFAIRDLFTWANADDFWRSNILSPSKLRKQWDNLTVKQRSGGNGSQSTSDFMADLMASRKDDPPIEDGR